MVPGLADGARSSVSCVPDTHEVDAWTLFCLLCFLHTLLSQWECFPCCPNGNFSHVVPMAIVPMLPQWQFVPCCPNGNLSHVVPLAFFPMLSQWHFFPCCPNGNFPHGKFRSLSPKKPNTTESRYPTLIN